MAKVKLRTTLKPVPERIKSGVGDPIRDETNNLEYIFFRNLKDLKFKFP